MRMRTQLQLQVHPLCEAVLSCPCACLLAQMARIRENFSSSKAEKKATATTDKSRAKSVHLAPSAPFLCYASCWHGVFVPG